MGIQRYRIEGVCVCGMGEEAINLDKAGTWVSYEDHEKEVNELKLFLESNKIALELLKKTLTPININDACCNIGPLVQFKEGYHAVFNPEIKPDND